MVVPTGNRPQLSLLLIMQTHGNIMKRTMGVAGDGNSMLTFLELAHMVDALHLMGSRGKLQISLNMH